MSDSDILRQAARVIRSEENLNDTNRFAVAAEVDRIAGLDHDAANNQALADIASDLSPAPETIAQPEPIPERRAPDQDAALEATFDTGIALDVLPPEDRRH